MDLPQWAAIRILLDISRQVIYKLIVEQTHYALMQTCCSVKRRSGELAFLTMAKICRFGGTVCPR